MLSMVMATLGFGLPWQEAAASSPSPSQVLAASKSAADAELSLHYSSTTKVPAQSVTVTITGDVSAAEGQQTIVANINGQVGHVSVDLVDGSAYFRGDEPGLANFMGLPLALSSQYANKWISLSSSDSGYSTVAAGLTTASVLGEIAISRPLSLKGNPEVLGHRAIGLGGTASAAVPGSTKKVAIPVRLYVQARGKALPVLYTKSPTVNKKKESLSVAFGDWNEHVSVTAPVGATPISALGASPVEA
jgi:hypothetical protein